MKHFNRFFAVFLVALLFVLQFACAPNMVESAVTPTPEATAAPTPTPSPVPTAVPTPAVDEYGFTEERKAELNQQIQDFLSYHGEFTREKMLEMMMEIDSNLGSSEVGLGIADIQPKVQGYFFDYFENDGILFMLMGFDGKDGSRFVTPVEIALYFYEGCDPEQTMFWVEEFKVNNIMGIDYNNNNDVVNSNDNIEVKDYGDESKLNGLLTDLKNKIIVLGFNLWKYPRSDAEVFGQAGFEYLDESNSKVGLSFGLIELVSPNDVYYDNQNNTNGDSSSILIINNIEDIYSIDITKVPIVGSISYFAGILNPR